MRVSAMLLVVVLPAVSALYGWSGTALAAERIRLAQTSNVTNYMMTCNSQDANCQTTCVVPGAAPTGATATSNANLSTACQLSCSSTQIACQTNGGRQSPSP
jgi:hypothetical protein